MQIRQRAVAALLAGSLLLQAGCGTLLYPERRGQLPSGLDPVVVVLNGIGCLFYVIPGVIAFAIDFATGAIYLPEGSYGMAPQRLGEALDRHGQLDVQQLRRLIREDTGLDLPLDHPQLIQSRATPQQLAALALPPSA